MYEGNPIAFDFANGHRMVNMTHMARAFKKRPNHFLRLTSAKLFILELKKQVAESQLGSDDFKVVDVQHGGKRPGTWGHELLALKFAGWLSPAFEVWMMECIKEKLTGQNHSSILSSSQQLQMPLLMEKEQELRGLVLKLLPIAGTGQELATLAKVDNSIISRIKNNKWDEVSPEIFDRLLATLRRFDRYGLGSGHHLDADVVDALMRITDNKARTVLYNYLKALP